MSDEQVFFSIVLPTYNRAQMLPRAIRSVLEQSFNNWELIIVDDGSTDDTRKAVGEFKDPRIIYVYQENAERSAARNKGIDLSSGKYICFLDSDDFYLPHHLEEFHTKIKEQNEPVALLYSSLFTEMNEILFLPEEITFEYNTISEYVLQKVIGPPQVCIHSKILKEIQFNPELSVGEDLNLWLRILIKYPLVIAVDKRTLVVGLHEGRSVNIMLNNNYKDSLNSFKITIKDKIIKKKIDKKLRFLFICECYLGMGKYHIFHHNRFSALIMIFHSMFYKPKYQLKFKLNLMYCLTFDFQKALEIAK